MLSCGLQPKLAADKLFDLGYIRVRLFHIFLRVLHIAMLQRLLRERQFITRLLL